MCSPSLRLLPLRSLALTLAFRVYAPHPSLALVVLPAFLLPRPILTSSSLLPDPPSAGRRPRQEDLISPASAFAPHNGDCDQWRRSQLKHEPAFFFGGFDDRMLRRLKWQLGVRAGRLSCVCTSGQAFLPTVTIRPHAHPLMYLLRRPVARFHAVPSDRPLSPSRGCAYVRLWGWGSATEDSMIMISGASMTPPSALRPRPPACRAIGIRNQYRPSIHDAGDILRSADYR
ncbi:hypothetical protein C8R45DRAFT_1104026 [Mycena sanguinolenta]|nr:hypothetical protein C8R45DRAFT_1104026 [Mycena sanguinolenta]